MSGSPGEDIVPKNVINSNPALNATKDAKEAHRCNSLYDLETDKLLRVNQKTEETPTAPEWKNSKYKICGSFVDDKKGEQTLQLKPSNLANVVIGEQQQQKPVQTAPSGLKRTSGSKLFHRRETAEQDVVVKKVENVDEVLPTKSPAQRHPAPPPLLQMSPGMPSMPHMRHPQGPLMNSFPSNFSLEMAKRNSLLDFEKTMQYLHQTNTGNYANYQNMLNNQTIFNSFLSNSSGSFSNLLSFNHRRRKQSNNPGGSAENNFNIDHVREVEETEYANRMPQQVAQARAMNFKRPRDYQSATPRSKKRGKWSESEDRVLQKLATTFLNRNEKINFKKIADHLAGRSAKQCREHWLSTLNPELKKGRWTKAEEVKLLELMISHGKSWSVIAKHIPGRAEHSVKAKGRLMLGERLKTVSNSAVAYTGSEEQKRQLIELHSQAGNEFDEISKQCGMIISPAKIERVLLGICSCPSCTAMNEEVKETKMNNFLQGWTMVKSRHIKESMMKKSSKYYQQQLLAQQQASGLSQTEPRQVPAYNSSLPPPPQGLVEDNGGVPPPAVLY